LRRLHWLVAHLLLDLALFSVLRSFFRGLIPDLEVVHVLFLLFLLFAVSSQGKLDLLLSGRNREAGLLSLHVGL